MASRQSDEWNSSHIGRLLECRRLSQAEFEVAKVWRGVYLEYLASIGAPGYETPEAISDEECEKLSKRVERAVNELKAKVGRRALHAVNSLVVYEEPEELGDFELTVEAAKVGLAHLARVGV
jgi:hypothetical protein